MATEPIIDTPEPTVAAPVEAAATEPTIPTEPAQAATVDSSSTTEVPPVEATEPTIEAKPAEETPETKPADRVVPALADYVLPEGVPESVAQFASENDMTQAQLDATMQQMGMYMQGSEQARQDAVLANGQALVDSWGKQKASNLSVAQRALSQNDPDGTLKGMLDESGYGNHPAVLTFLLSIGNSMKEGGFLKGANNTQSKAGLSAAQSMFGASHPSSN